jgi:hypothetical protein
MLSSLESYFIVGAFVVQTAGATRAFRHGQGRIGRPGSKTMCKRELGFPRNLGAPVVPTESPGWGYRVTNPRPAAAARSDGGSETCVIRGTAK